MANLNSKEDPTRAQGVELGVSRKIEKRRSSTPAACSQLFDRPPPTISLQEKAGRPGPAWLSSLLLTGSCTTVRAVYGPRDTGQTESAALQPCLERGRRGILRNSARIGGNHEHAWNRVLDRPHGTEEGGSHRPEETQGTMGGPLRCLRSASPP